MTPALHIDIAWDSANKHREELCGDKVEIIRQEGSVIAVLADGLGSGVKANILATLTSKIIGTLIAEGLTIDEAVETIVSTLPVCRERGIGYCTFTILQITDEGECYLAEFDNPAAFWFHRGRALPLNPQTREIDGKSIRETRFRVQCDDLIVLVSDGVVHAGIGQTLNLGWRWERVSEYLVSIDRPGASARSVSKLLLSATTSLYANEPGDDATVVAIRARRPAPLSVLVGPPLKSEEDGPLVRAFLARPGRKAVCGGATSQIVAREMGTEVRANLDYDNPAIPPTGEIDGIDLVTEGVLTLRRTLELIQACLQEGSSMSDYLSLERKDGASRLARLLLEESTSVFFSLGRAINPAHQNPEFPLSLGLKLRLVEDMADCLRKAGKQVTVEYH